MKEFLSGLFTAGDNNASMAKVMTWIVFIAFLAGWLFWPEKSLSELLTMYGLLLGYALGGKASYNLGGRGPRPGERNHDGHRED